ncbi:MAG: serine/threonine-protein kinase [Candidatus Contendobacter sp.]|nr:serine/threonine-protein kinase [Candidatus Contendobacter sp.]
MDRATHCPNCFREPAPTPCCRHCGFDAASYLETNEILPLFTALAGGKYRVGRVMGEGGFGVVYAGLAQRLKRPVAIKEFFPAVDNPLAQRQGITVTARPRYQDAFANWKEQFLREAELLAQFSHSRIVQVHDIVEENNTVYLIMERLEGQTLSEHLGGLQERGDQLAAGRALSPEDGQRLLHAALEALDALHGHIPPVLHRDLTPHNLFLVGDRIDGLKVLDFGLARLGERTQSAVSLAVRVGNPGFAAPEQLGLYPGAITPATDFYALGATLYTALAGVAPPNARQRCAQQPPQSLPLLPNVDPTPAQVIRACLELSPQQRPKSVAEIRQRLAASTIIPPLKPEPEPPLQFLGHHMNHQLGGPHEPHGVSNMHYKTRELNFFQKFLQAYWFIPSSWLLDEITIANGILKVLRKKGDRFEAPLSDVQAKLDEDGRGRRVITIRCGKEKIRFIEIPNMLSEGEWNAIISALNPTKKSFIEDILFFIYGIVKKWRSIFSSIHN